MTAAKNSDQWTLISYPGVQKPLIVAYGPSYGVMKTTPERQFAAWVFLRWLLSPENQAKWVQATGLLPLRLSALPSLGEFESASPQWAAAVKDIDLARGVPQLASWARVRYVLEDGLNTVFQNNTPVAQLPAILIEMDTLAQQLNK
jgi:ABC-type glycerol-3-phosphate transport system substrate-binding protein